jgi:hypothetical protein
MHKKAFIHSQDYFDFCQSDINKKASDLPASLFIIDFFQIAFFHSH